MSHESINLNYKPTVYKKISPNWSYKDENPPQNNFCTNTTNNNSNQISSFDSNPNENNFQDTVI